MTGSLRQLSTALAITALLAGPLVHDAAARRSPQRTKRMAKVKKNASRLLAALVAVSLVAPAAPALAAPPGEAPNVAKSELSVPSAKPYASFYVKSAKDGVLVHGKVDKDGPTPWTYGIHAQQYAKSPVAKHLAKAMYYGLDFKAVAGDLAKSHIVLEARDKKTGEAVGTVTLTHHGEGVSGQIFQTGSGPHLGLWVLKSGLSQYGLRL